MKKVSLFLAVVLMLMSFGSFAQGENADYSDKKVVVLLTGTIADGGWNYIGYSCVNNLAEKYGVEASYVESIAVSDMNEYLRMYAMDGFDMIIVHGSEFIDNVKSVAPEYPDVVFAISYGDSDLSDGIPNVACVGPKNMGIMVGAILGVLTDANHVCFLGGTDNPSVSSVVNKIEEGVHLTNPGCKVDTAYIGTITDSSLAKEKALQYIASGVDAISGGANSAQLGILEAAADEHILAVGFNNDQYNLQPEAVVISVYRAFPAMYENLFMDIVNNSFEGGLHAYGLTEGGTVVSEWHGWDEKLPAEKVEKVNQVVADLFAGVYGAY